MQSNKQKIYDTILRQ